MRSTPEHAESFEWDDELDESGNTAHLCRSRPGVRRVEQWEVEEVFYNGGVFARNKNAGSGDWKLVGRTDSGRALTIVVHYNEETKSIRAITAWDSTRADRNRYLGGESS